MEYGAPLIYNFKQFTRSKKLLEPIQKLQDEAISWIFNTGTRNIKILNGILGALTVDQRFSHLRCGFQLHLDHSAAGNPIKPLISSSTFSQFLYFLRNNDLYVEFSRIPDLPTNYIVLKMEMSGFLLSRRSGILSKSSSILVNYIPITARSSSLIDKVLRSPIRYQRMFLSWRRGSSATGTKGAR